jgi:hypothetical protein
MRPLLGGRRRDGAGRGCGRHGQKHRVATRGQKSGVVAAALHRVTRPRLPIGGPARGVFPLSNGQDEKNTSAPLVLTPVVAARAAAMVESLRGSLKEWFAFYDGFVPEFSWWVRQPFQALDTQLDGHAKFLRTELAGLKGEPDDPLIGDPVGAEALARQISTELLPWSRPTT